MAFSDVITRPAVELYTVFRGTFASGAAVAWGDCDVVHPGGPIRGVLTGPGEVARALPDRVGAPPSRFDVTLEVANDRGQLGPYLVGTTIPSPSVEYLSDSVLNLKGRLYLGVADPDAPGTFYEEPLTPELVLTQAPEYNGDVVVLAFSSQDYALHQPSNRALRVDQIKTAALTDPATGQRLLFSDGSTDTVDADRWAGINNRIVENLSARVPWIYGASPIPLTRVSTDDGPLLFLAGVVTAAKNPLISDAMSWEFYSERYENVGGWAEAEVETITGDVLAVPGEVGWVGKVPLTVTLDDGTTTSVWAIFVSTRSGVQVDEELARERQYVIPSTRSLGIATSAPPRNQGGPARLIEEIVEDHGGSVDAASFARCRAAIGSAPFGGVYYGDSSPAEVISHIAEAAGIELWTGLDGYLHARPAGGWAEADRLASVSASTPWVRDGQVFGDVVEVIPVGDMRGAAASRIDVEWPDEVRNFFEDTPFLAGRVPGVTSIPQAQLVIAKVSGAWVDPRELQTALRSISLRRLWVTRQLRCLVPPWVATYELGTVMLLSYSRGLGPAGVSGYDRRPVMLTACTFSPGEDFARVTFDDLSGVAAINPCRVDAYAQWLIEAPSGVSLSLVAGSAVVETDLDFFDGGAHEGHYLDTMGAADPDNRRQFRIESVISPTQALVEFEYAANETITAGIRSDSLMQKWSVVRGHEASGGYSYRPEYHRNCIEADGIFRNGEPGQQVTGG